MCVREREREEEEEEEEEEEVFPRSPRSLGGQAHGGRVLSGPRPERLPQAATTCQSRRRGAPSPPPPPPPPPHLHYPRPLSLHAPLGRADRPVRARVRRALFLVPVLLLQALVVHVVVGVAVAGLVGGGEAGVVRGGADLTGEGGESGGPGLGG